MMEKQVRLPLAKSLGAMLFMLVMIAVPLGFLHVVLSYGPMKWTTLHLLARLGAVHEVLPLLSSWNSWRDIPTDLEAVDSLGQTALHVAAAGCISSSVEALLQAGSKVNSHDSKLSTPLHLAMRAPPFLKKDTWLPVDQAAVATAYRDHCHNTIQTLITHGADLGAQDNRTRTPFIYAVVLNKPAIVQIFLENRVLLIICLIC